MPLDSLPPPSPRVEMICDTRPAIKKDTNPFRSNSLPTKGTFRRAPKLDDNHQNAVPVIPPRAPSAPVYSLVAIEERREDVERRKNKHPLFPKRQRKDAETFGSERPAGTEEAFAQERINRRTRSALARVFTRGAAEGPRAPEARESVFGTSFIDRVVARIPAGITSPKLLFKEVREAVNDELHGRPNRMDDATTIKDGIAQTERYKGSIGPMVRLLMRERKLQRRIERSQERKLEAESEEYYLDQHGEPFGDFSEDSLSEVLKHNIGELREQAYVDSLVADEAGEAQETSDMIALYEQDDTFADKNMEHGLRMNGSDEYTARRESISQITAHLRRQFGISGNGVNHVAKGGNGNGNGGDIESGEIIEGVADAPEGTGFYDTASPVQRRESPPLPAIDN